MNEYKHTNDKPAISKIKNRNDTILQYKKSLIKLYIEATKLRKKEDENAAKSSWQKTDFYLCIFHK